MSGLKSNKWSVKTLISFYQDLLDRKRISPNGPSAARLEILKSKVSNKYNYRTKSLQ